MDRAKWRTSDAVLTLRQCILAMSDIQIATGLAVLISGYHEIPRISAYHWMIVVYTA